jgi:N-acetyl-gamma-glutamyl-phosphate reductase
MVSNPKTCVIDASTAHRVAPGWTFGLPELGRDQRARIRAAKRIANPGCHASGFIVAVKPLVASGVLPAESLIACFSLTGYSGGGKKMIEQYQAGGAHLSGPRPYALGLTHKHLPEMREHTGLATAPHFIPVVGNFYKGMLVTVQLHTAQMAAGATREKIHTVLANFYAGEPFVRVMPLGDPNNLDDGFLDPQGCNDTNRIDLFVLGNETQVIVAARLDNLGKGASGAAVQAMNVHLGVAEGMGL